MNSCFPIIPSPAWNRHSNWGIFLFLKKSKHTAYVVHQGISGETMYFLFLMRKQINFWCFQIFKYLYFLTKTVKTVKVGFLICICWFLDRERKKESEWEGEREKETSICCSPYLWAHWLFFIRALPGDGPRNLGLLVPRFNQLSSLARTSKNSFKRKNTSKIWFNKDKL